MIRDRGSLSPECASERSRALGEGRRPLANPLAGKRGFRERNLFVTLAGRLADRWCVRPLLSSVAATLGTLATLWVIFRNRHLEYSVIFRMPFYMVIFRMPEHEYSHSQFTQSVSDLPGNTLPTEPDLPNIGSARARSKIHCSNSTNGWQGGASPPRAPRDLRCPS